MKRYGERVALRLYPEQREKIEQLISIGKYENLSHVVRTALKKFLETA